MPITIFDKQTGRRYQIPWDSPRDPTEQEIDQLIRRTYEPPAGMEPQHDNQRVPARFQKPVAKGLTGGVRQDPAVLAAMPKDQGNVRPYLDLVRGIMEQQVLSGNQDPAQQATAFRQLREAGPFGLGGAARAADAAIQQAQPTTVGELLSYPAMSATPVGAVASAPFIASGTSKALDEEGSTVSRALGALEAVGGAAGVLGGIPRNSRAAAPAPTSRPTIRTEGGRKIIEALEPQKSASAVQQLTPEELAFQEETAKQLGRSIDRTVKARANQRTAENRTSNQAATAGAKADKAAAKTTLDVEKTHQAANDMRAAEEVAAAKAQQKLIDEMLKRQKAYQAKARLAKAQKEMERGTPSVTETVTAETPTGKKSLRIPYKPAKEAEDAAEAVAPTTARPATKLGPGEPTVSDFDPMKDSVSELEFWKNRLKDETGAVGDINSIKKARADVSKAEREFELVNRRLEKAESINGKSAESSQLRHQFTRANNILSDARNRLRQLTESESGVIDPSIITGLYTNPLARSAIGGAIGYNVAPEDRKWTGLMAGALGANFAAPARFGGLANALPNAERFSYETMLSGPAQISNIMGNIGSAVTAPFLEASRGQFGNANQLLRSLTAPGVASTFQRGFKSGWSANTPTKFTGHLPMGPAGKMLNAVDQGTRGVLEAGGVLPEMAREYTFQADPITRIGKAIQMAQQIGGGPAGGAIGAGIGAYVAPDDDRLGGALAGGLAGLLGVKAITPFIRTAVKQVELGAAHSPLRAFSPNLRKAFPAANPNNVPAWRNPYEYTAMAPAAIAGAAGAYGIGHSNNPITAAGYGAMAAPYSIARGLYDYNQYGKEGASGADAVRAVVNQMPFLSDVSRFVDDPTRFPGQLAARFIPPLMYAFGNRQIREPRGESAFDVEGFIRDRIPGARNSLPLQYDYFGNPMERTILTQRPAALYESNNYASQMAGHGALARRQSRTIPGLELNPHEASELERLRGQNMFGFQKPFYDQPDLLSSFPAWQDEALANTPEGPRRDALKALMSIGLGNTPRTQDDIYRQIKQMGIEMGTQQFLADYARRKAQELTGGPQP